MEVDIKWIKKWWPFLAIILAIVILIGWKEKRCENAACDSSGYFCHLFSAANLPNIFLVLIGVVGIIVAIWTLGILQEQTRAALTGALAAQESIDVMKSKERPRIRIKVSPLSLKVAKVEELGINEVIYQIHVLCPTPAFVTDSSVGTHITDSLEPPTEPFYGSINLPDIISDKERTFEFKEYLFDVNSESEVKDIHTSKKFVYFQASIKFTDVFDTEDEVSVRLFWHSREGLYGLALLGDGDDEGPFYVGEWVSVAEQE